jgi:MoxR-like ATPase
MIGLIGAMSVETDALKAIEHGGILVLEEINLADPSVIMGALGQCIEAPFVLMKNGYEAIRRHPLLVVVGTMNIGTYGSKSINQALSSRFKQAYILNDNKEDDFINILKQQVTSSSITVDESSIKAEEYEPIEIKEKHIKWVYMAYDKIINILKSPEKNAEDIALSVTMRGCIGALENIEEGEAPKEAIKNTLIGKIAEADLEMATDIAEDIDNLRNI